MLHVDGEIKADGIDASVAAEKIPRTFQVGENAISGTLVDCRLFRDVPIVWGKSANRLIY